MQFTQEHVQMAVEAGLALTNPESDLLEVFRKHGGGVSLLRSLLAGIANGQIALAPATQQGDPEPPKEPEATPNKKVAKKKAAKTAS